MILGLDLSLTSTGIAVIDLEGQIIHTSRCGYSLTRDSKADIKIRRLLAIARQVVNVAKEFEVSKVSIENYAFNARGAQNDLGELHGSVKTQLVLQGFVPEVISCTQARKIVFGKGKLKKDEIVAKINQMGYNVTDHNIADALVIALAQRKKDESSTQH